MEAYKVRVVANACLTRWKRGERSMNDILDGYNMTDSDKAKVVAEITAKNPTLDFDAK